MSLSKWAEQKKKDDFVTTVQVVLENACDSHMLLKASECEWNQSSSSVIIT